MATSPVKKILPFPKGAAVAHGGHPRLSRDELAFLPAALEIIETPPSPMGRVLAISIAAFATLALAWACWGSIDIVSTATGKIIPSTNTKTVQPFETGVVRSIQVEDGQVVKAGDVLIELDTTMNTAEREHLASDYLSARLDIARLRGALKAIADQNLRVNSVYQPPADASPTQMAVNLALLEHLVAEQRAKVSSLERQKGQREAERATTLTGIDKLNSTLPILRERVAAKKYLADREIGSRLSYLELLQDLTDREQEMVVQKSRLREADAAIATIAEQRRQVEAEFQRTTLTDLAQAEQKASALRQDLIKADQRTALQRLTAPVDGTVQQLQVHTVGGVVTPAQALMVIVPADAKLEIEAMVPNKDIGFVEAGQEAEIKVDTFNFTKYGLIKGRVESVSRDAISRDRPATGQDGKPQSTAANAAAGGSGQELVYSARVSLEKTAMPVEGGKLINLSPGMAVTVEIKTGQRRLIEYVLSPVLRYRQESLRER